MPRARLRLRGRCRLALLAGLAALCACATTDGRLRLSAMKVEGNSGVSDEQIVGRLALEAEDGWAWSDERFLDPILFERDVPRVVRIYRAFGYYHATVDAVTVRWTPAGDGVVLTFHVTEGPPTILESLTLLGIDDLPPTARHDAQAAVRLHEGDVISEDAWNATKDGIRRALRNNGFPAPVVAGTVEIDEATDTATARITVDAGPPARFGEVRIEGLVDVPMPPIREEVGVVTGEPYSAAVLDDARAALVAAGVFSSVEVQEVPGPSTATQSSDESAGRGATQPQASEASTAASAPAESATSTSTSASPPTPTPTPTQEGVVDVDVQLEEGDMQRLKIGGGFATEQGRQLIEATASWEHRNLFGGLRRILWSNRFGWAFNLAVPESLGPSGSTSLTFRQPSETDLRLAFIASLKYEAVPTANDYSTQAIQARLGGERTFRDRTLSLGLHNGVRWVDLWDIAPGATVKDVPYLLYLLDFTLTLDLRDDPLQTREGYYVSVLLRAGLDPTGGNYDADPQRDFYRYVLLKGDLRGYYALHERLTLVLRVGAAMILPFGEDSLCPPDERLFSGGANSVRGFPYHAIGTWKPCEDPATGCVTPPPPGGNTLWEVSAELRIRIYGALSAAVFFDAGNVLDGTFRTVYPASIRAVHPTVGAGLRYLTAVGPIRLDIGVPLQEDSRLSPSPAVAFQLTLGEAF